MTNVESRICPICGKDNKCIHNKDCWCMETKVPKELIEKIPSDRRGKACICEACVDEFEQKTDN